MENIVRFSIRNNDKSQNNNCENISADIDFIITLSSERILKLKKAINNIDNNENVFAEKLISMISEERKSFSNVKPLTELETAVTAIMNELGIPAHTKGYRYLRDAIVMSTENPDLIGQVTKVLYPSIANLHNTTPVRVERVIRHAIEYCCMKGNQETVNSFF